MIVYESNKYWFRDIVHLTRSWTMTKVIRSVILVTVYTAIVTVLMVHFLKITHIGLSGSIFSYLGIVLSILLVFRTNSAYERWWEGRRLWGSLVNNSRSLATMVQAYFPEENTEIKKKMALLISNFSISLKEHLRNGVKYEELIGVHKEEMELYKSKKNLPSFILYQLHNELNQAYRRGDLTPEHILNVKIEIQNMYDILGGCERIKKTPIPFSYNVFLKIFISVYAILLPFGMIMEFMYWTIPLVALIFFTFIGIEMMAEEIEEPFGLDCNDLPTGDIAHTIKNNVFELLEVKSLQSEHLAGMYEKVF